MKKIALAVACGLMFLACRNMNHSSAELKNFSEPYKSIQDGKDLFPIYRKRSFDLWIAKELKMADALVLKTKKALDRETKSRDTQLPQYASDMDWTTFGRCLKESMTGLVKLIDCVGLANIPEDAGASAVKAIEAYTRILNVLDGEIRTQEEIEAITKANCVGSLYEGERQLCEEVVLMSDLYKKSYAELYFYYFNQHPTEQELNPDVQTPPEQMPKLSSINNAEAFERYVMYIQAAEDIREKLINYRSTLTTRLFQMSQGHFDNLPIYNIPNLAVVGSPDDFLEWVGKYSEKVTQLASDLVSRKKAAIELKIRQNSQETNQTELRSRLIEMQAQVGDDNNPESGSMQLEKSILENEDKQFEKEATNISAQIAATQAKFSHEMKAVLGDVESVSLLKTEQKVLQVNSSEQALPVIELSPNFDGVVEITGGANRFRANGIYFGTNQGAYYGWLKKTFGKAKNFVEKKVLPTANHCATGAVAGGIVLGGTGNVVGCVANVLDGGKTLGGPTRKLSSTLTPYDLAAEQKDNTKKMDDFQSENPGALTAMRGFLAISTPTVPISVQVEKLTADLKNLPTPKLNTHVFGAETDLNGYVVSTSIGTSVGLSEGTSTSISKSINVSMSTSTSRSNSTGASGGVGFLGIVSAGVNIGKSESVSFSDSVSKGESTSTGTSTGVSVGKNSGLSLQVGYYHPDAQYDHLRLGMLVGELYCGSIDSGNRLAYYPIGMRNFIKVRSADLKMANGQVCDSAILLRLIINDKLSAMNQDCGNRGCNSSDQIPLSVAIYTDTQSTFQNLLTVLGSDEFKQTIRDAAYSSDPVNNARTLFRQRAFSRFSIDEKTINKFMSVVDTEVALQLDLKKLEELALKRTQAILNIKKIEINRQAVLTKINFVSKMLDDGELNQNYYDTLETLNDAEYDIHSLRLSFYLQRLTYWLGLYEKSNLYHNNISSEIDVAELIRTKILAPLDKAKDQTSIAALEESLKNMSLSTKIEQYVDKQKESSSIKKLVEEKRIDHCYIDFADVLKVKYPKSKQKPVDLFTSDFFLSSLGKFASDPLMDENVYNDLQGVDIATNGYRTLEFRTDPGLTSSNWLDPMAMPELVERSEVIKPTAPLRCFDSIQAQRGKMLGVAFTYVLNTGDVDSTTTTPQALYLYRDKLTWSYVKAASDSLYFNSEIGSRFYSLIDYSSLTDVWKWNKQLRMIRPINLRNEQNLLQTCRLDNNETNWKSSECMKKLLGENLLNSSRAAPAELNFYNQHLGGDWKLYIPNTDPYRQSFKELNRLRLHIYFTTEVAL